MPTSSLPIDLVEPDAPAPAGDRLPCHLFAEEVDWPTAPEAVLRADRAPAGSMLDALGPWMEADLDPPPPSCPPCTGRCHQGRDCPAFAPLRALRIESLADAQARHRRFGRRLVLAVVVGWLAMVLFLLSLP